MDLRDVVETLIELDDQQRTITNEINRALDGLERAVVASRRFGVGSDWISALKGRLATGSDETQTLEDLVAEIRKRLVDDTCRGLANMADAEGEVAARGREKFGHDLDTSMQHALAAGEQVGRLKHLLSQRGSVAARLEQVQREIGSGPEAAELVTVVLAARDAAAERATHDSVNFVTKAELVAEEDGALAGISANVRALRTALLEGEESKEIADDLIRRIVDTSLRLTQEREDCRRRLANLERDSARRQEVSQGLFQAITKASEVIDLASRLEDELAGDALQDGALGPLKATCIEHGVITLLLDLRRVRMDRESLDAAVDDLSAELGMMFSGIAHEPELVDRLSRVWDDLSAIDAGAIESDWEDTYSEVLRVRKEGSGVLSITPEGLATLTGADGLDPWLTLLIKRVDEKAAGISTLVERLESVDAVLTEVLTSDHDAAELAAGAKASLASFVGEVCMATEAYYSAIRTKLAEEDTGFRKVQAHLSAFGHAAELGPDATKEERDAAFGATLAEVKQLFIELESALPADESATDWMALEETAREETASLQRTLAGVLASMKRLSELLFPELPETCVDALGLADKLRRSAKETLARLGGGSESAIEQLGNALEALYFEKLYYESLELPAGTDIRVVAGVSRERNRRLLDLYGATLGLLFQMLQLIGQEYDEQPDDEKPGHFSWMEELLTHARSEIENHMERLEDCLFDLEDNDERFERFSAAFDAYHGWAMYTANADAGHDLLEAKGKALFEEFEAHFTGLGISALDPTVAFGGDPRVAARVEELVGLYAFASEALSLRPTMTDVGKAFDDLRTRAEQLAEQIEASRVPD